MDMYKDENVKRITWIAQKLNFLLHKEDKIVKISVLYGIIWFRQETCSYVSEEMSYS